MAFEDQVVKTLADIQQRLERIEENLNTEPQANFSDLAEGLKTDLAQTVEDSVSSLSPETVTPDHSEVEGLLQVALNKLDQGAIAVKRQEVATQAILLGTDITATAGEHQQAIEFMLVQFADDRLQNEGMLIRQTAIAVKASPSKVYHPELLNWVGVCSDEQYSGPDRRGQAAVMTQTLPFKTWGEWGTKLQAFCQTVAQGNGSPIEIRDAAQEALNGS